MTRRKLFAISCYLDNMAFVGMLLNHSIITTDEYCALEHSLREKYKLPSNSIYREIFGHHAS